eukprot:10093725-Ditylum_brightwellii.AAC.1
MKLNKSKHTIKAIVVTSDNSIAVPLQDLLSKIRKSSINMSMILLLHKALMNFCEEKNIIISGINSNDDSNSTISYMTHITGLTLDMDDKQVRPKDISPKGEKINWAVHNMEKMKSNRQTVMGWRYQKQMKMQWQITSPMS